MELYMPLSAEMRQALKALNVAKVEALLASEKIRFYKDDDVNEIVSLLAINPGFSLTTQLKRVATGKVFKPTDKQKELQDLQKIYNIFADQGLAISYMTLDALDDSGRDPDDNLERVRGLRQAMLARESKSVKIRLLNIEQELAISELDFEKIKQLFKNAEFNPSDQAQHDYVFELITRCGYPSAARLAMPSEFRVEDLPKIMNALNILRASGLRPSREKILELQNLWAVNPLLKSGTGRNRLFERYHRGLIMLEVFGSQLGFEASYPDESIGIVGEGHTKEKIEKKFAAEDGATQETIAEKLTTTEANVKDLRMRCVNFIRSLNENVIKDKNGAELLIILHDSIDKFMSGLSPALLSHPLIVDLKAWVDNPRLFTRANAEFCKRDPKNILLQRIDLASHTRLQAAKILSTVHQLNFVLKVGATPPRIPKREGGRGAGDRASVRISRVMPPPVPSRKKKLVLTEEENAKLTEMVKVLKADLAEIKAGGPIPIRKMHLALVKFTLNAGSAWSRDADIFVNAYYITFDSYLRAAYNAEAVKDERLVEKKRSEPKEYLDEIVKGLETDKIAISKLTDDLLASVQIGIAPKRKF
jgi:hypothetical protein